MKSTRLLSLTGLFIGGAILLAACGSDDADVVPTPIFEPTAAPSGDAPVATAVPTVSASPTAVPTAVPAMPAGDAANGEAVFTGASGCTACHSTGSNTVVGPGLSGVGATAESRVAGESVDEYLTNSIVSPNAFVVPDFFPSIMPSTFAQTLTEQEIKDLVAYLVTLP